MTEEVEPRGLSSQEAAAKLASVGRNEITIKKPGALAKFVKWFVAPIPLMLLAAAGFSLIAKREDDFILIIVLFFANFGIGLWHEGKADKAIEQLQEKLNFDVRTKRDGKWVDVQSTELVPGDVIELSVGDIVAADIRIIKEKNVSINESAVTGESLPSQKHIGDISYSGSFLTTGWAMAEVTATGHNTYFGRTLHLVEGNNKVSFLETDILTISKFLSAVSILAAIILTIVFLIYKAPLLEVITLDLSLLIAGIPVAMPTVMSLIISVGVLELAKKNAIVRRLSSLEDLANVSLLLSDKTGTLTQNEIRVAKVRAYGNYKEDELLAYAASPALEDSRSAIDQALARKAKDLGIKVLEHIDFTPADSERKRSTVIVKRGESKVAASIGASQVIAGLCDIDDKTKAAFKKDVEGAAKQGYRTLGVAINSKDAKEEHMDLAGLIYLSDTLHDDSKNVISFLAEHGIGVKMITGDNHAITRRVVAELKLPGTVVTREVVKEGEHTLTAKQFDTIGAFSEILPADKLRLVKLAQHHYTVAVTGDGVNDLPALKTANVGIAVRNAVDALKSSADIVLLSNGISVIKDAIIEARKIFSRVYYYSVYRISESFRVILAIAMLGLMYKDFPLTPIQLIILAILNDIPIVSLAFDHVLIPQKPEKIRAKERFLLSSTLGTTGLIQSLVFFFIARNLLHIPLPIVQTMFFLKLTISGHMLIYVAHTRKVWYRFLPSKEVIFATTATQLVATIMAIGGIAVAAIPIGYAAFVWVWTFVWMQIVEVAKQFEQRLTKSPITEVDSP